MSRLIYTRRRFLQLGLSAGVAAGLAGCTLPTKTYWKPFEWALICNSGADSITVLDTPKLAMKPGVPVGAGPTALDITQDGKQAFVANMGVNSVSVIDIQNLVRITTIPVGAGPSDIVIQPDGLVAYVANTNGKSVSVIDVKKLELIGTFYTGERPGNLQLVRMPGGEWRCYISNTGDDQIAYIQGKAPFVGAVRVVAVANPLALPLRSSKEIYVAQMGGTSVTIFETPNHTQVSKVAIGKNPVHLAVTPDDKHVLISNRDSNDVSVIETASRKRVAQIATGLSPGYIAFTQNGAQALIANEDSDEISIIDVDNLEITSTITVGSEPVHILVEGYWAYVVCRGDDEIALIHLPTERVHQRFSAGRRPTQIAIRSVNSMM